MLSDNYAGNCCIVQKYGFITFINDKRVRNVGIKVSKNFVDLVNAQLLLVGKRIPMLSADFMGHPPPPPTLAFFGLLATALAAFRGEALCQEVGDVEIVFIFFMKLYLV